MHVQVSGFLANLQDLGLLRYSDVQRAEEVRARTGGTLPATLAKLGLVSEAELASAIGAANNFPLAGPQQLLEATAVPDVNVRYLMRRAVLPLSVDGDCLTLAMADPEDGEARAAMAFATGAATVAPVVATFSDIEDALIEHYGALDQGVSLDQFASSGATEDFERMLEGESEAPVIRIVQRLLTNAVNRRASDVHIEPMARFVAVRYRIDGRLVEVERHPDALAEPLASRIKVMAGLDIAESRLPQDGRLRLTVRGREVDVRVSTSPIVHGESIVMRLLGRSEVPLDLTRLGLPALALAKLNRALDRPHGIVLLTGPTGSGKTTTLYAALNRLRRPEVKILTVEDPVEYMLEGINQVQVRPEIDLSYAATLRAFLRQDPDILMIGEIRDTETAEIAMRAALTGHLVLSTLHTNSAIGAFTRLADIGIEPYLTGSTVIAAIAQRLVRTLCTECRSARVPLSTERAMFATHDIVPPDKVFDSVGCAHCAQTGYNGRVPVIEVLEVDEAMRERIRARDVDETNSPVAPPETLLGHGLTLIAEGRTSFAEIARAVDTL